MRICFLTTGHFPSDERIYHLFAKTLQKENYECIIISSREVKRLKTNGIVFDSFDDHNLKKTQKFAILIEKLKTHQPSHIICSEHLPVLAAKKFAAISDNKIKIILDVTEWYPSKKNLENSTFIKKVYIFLKLLAFNLYCTRFVNGFIFGEYYKSLPYRFLFRKKKYIKISYFPDLDTIKLCEPQKITNKLNLIYSGRVSLEKGFGNLINVINYVAKLKLNLNIYLDIIETFASEKDAAIKNDLILKLPKNVQVNQFTRLDYHLYLKKLSKVHIFFDLRRKDFENDHCLPIKIFDYIALKRPVIYTDLKAIRKEIKFEKFCYLLEPDDYKSIAEIVFSFIDNPEIYLKACNEARIHAEKYYNWGKIKYKFINFIKEL